MAGHRSLLRHAHQSEEHVVISGAIESEDLSTKEHMLTGHTQIEKPWSEKDAGAFAPSTAVTAERSAS